MSRMADNAEELPPLVWNDFIEAMKRVQVQYSPTPAPISLRTICSPSVSSSVLLPDLETFENAGALALFCLHALVVAYQIQLSHRGPGAANRAECQSRGG